MTTGVQADVSKGSVKFRAGSAAVNGTTMETQKVAPKPKVRSMYNHLFAIHAKSRPSPLSRQDQPEAPNYNGFRNLMALVLGMPSPAMCARHMLMNAQWYRTCD